MLNPLEHPICLDLPDYLEKSAWIGHIPFAFYVMSSAQPKVFVELGTYRGVSYFSFCQAVKKLNLETKCFAVDTWQGDDHAGELDQEILSKLREYQNPLYQNFATFIQSTFDSALEKFADKTVDLLHIDGFHTYEAVSHDFETWLPKMSDSGIVLFHDTQVREREFGVWKFWEEVSAKYPHFEFSQSHGLGVLAVGKNIPQGIKSLFTATADEKNIIDDFFTQLGSRIDDASLVRTQKNYIENLEKYNEVLKSYEKVVQDSNVMKGYRILTQEGISSLIKKTLVSKK